jgi:integrase
LVKEKEQERAGLIPPKALRESASTPLSEHLSDYLADLRILGRDDVYVENLDYRLKILIKECGWTQPNKITADSFTAWRAKQKKASTTLNQYLDCISAMLNWMLKKGRVSHNFLIGVEKIERLPAWRRRAFADDELSRLLDVAGESRLGYLLAVHTGLRRAELKALSWENINLDADVPFVSLGGQFTKNKKTAHIPLHRDLVVELRNVKPSSVNPSDPVLTGKMLPSMWKMRKDMQKAGIEYKSDLGRADFHSLRHTLATNLARQKIAPRVAMEIMRHSDIRLTMNHYTDASQLPVYEAIESLPSFGLSVAHGDTQRDTQTTDFCSNRQSPAGTELTPSDPSKVIYPEEFWHELTPLDTLEQSEAKSCLARTRT